MFTHSLLGLHSCLWPAFVFISWLSLHFYIIVLSSGLPHEGGIHAKGPAWRLTEQALGIPGLVELVAKQSSYGISGKF